MRILIVLVLVAAAGWAAYWVVGSRMLRAAIDDGIETMEQNGVTVETDGIRVTGFPNRFDTMIDGPRLAWPGGTAWSAPFLQVFALSYRPNQVIVAFPEAQTLDTPRGAVSIDSARARASALFRRDSAGTLDHANLVAEDVRLAWRGREVTLGRLLAATRVPADADAGRQNIGLTLDDVELPAGILPAMAGDARIVDGLTLNAFLDLSEPLSRAALATGGIAVRRIEIERVDLDWGGVALDAAGALDVGADGALSGALDVTVTHWRRALEMAATSGLVTSSQIRMAEQGFAALAAMSGRDDRLSTTLELRDGRVWLGPLPLGRAPRL